MPDSAPIGAAADRVAVVGGGWAGCAAAVTLSAAGVPVTLFEQAKTLGGRARRVMHSDLALDNGQHLLVGAYGQTLELLALVHGTDGAGRLFRRVPLSLLPFGAARPDAVALSAWHAPAPLDLAAGVLSARGLSWREKFALIAGFRRLARADFRCPDEESVAQAFAQTPDRAMDAIWRPLCLAVLNTPPERASARMFAGVLRAAFTGSARNSDLLVPTVDLSACFPEPAARYVASHGGAVHAGLGARIIAHDSDGVTVEFGGRAEAFTGSIIAVGPHQLATVLGATVPRDDALRTPLAQVDAFAYESITTIYVGFAGPVAFRLPLLRLDDRPGQWVFDRTAILGQRPAGGAQSLVAVVISANGPHDGIDHTTLTAQVASQLRRLAPDLPAIAWSRVFAERRATYACTPMLTRPVHGRLAPRVYLAGDYTDPDFPATLEAACRSGVTAARVLLTDRAARSRNGCAADAAVRGSTRAP